MIQPRNPPLFLAIAFSISAAGKFLTLAATDEKLNFSRGNFHLRFIPRDPQRSHGLLNRLRPHLVIGSGMCASSYNATIAGKT